jgi:hypothetical protein
VSLDAIARCLHVDPHEAKQNSPKHAGIHVDTLLPFSKKGYVIVVTQNNKTIWKRLATVSFDCSNMYREANGNDGIYVNDCMI